MYVWVGEGGLGFDIGRVRGCACVCYVCVCYVCVCVVRRVSGGM